MERLGRSCPPTWHEDPTTPSSGLDPLLSIEELAEYLGVLVTTIYDWRVDGKGPCGVHPWHATPRACLHPVMLSFRVECLLSTPIQTCAVAFVLQ